MEYKKQTSKGKEIKETESQARNRLLTTKENRLMVTRSGEGGRARKTGDGEKGGTCCDRRQVMGGSVESLYCTPETSITLDVNGNFHKNLKKKFSIKY